MLIDESRRRQQQLDKLLESMARTLMDDDDSILPVVIEFNELYSGDFRHNYADIFSLIVRLGSDERTYSLDYLSVNLEAARNYVERDYVKGDKKYTRLYKPLLKLSDHLHLEIGRYNHSIIPGQQIADLEKQYQVLHAELKEEHKKLDVATKNLSAAETKLQTIETKLTKANKKLQKAEHKLSSIHIDIIAVLSIFASIVFTFSGSISVLGSALTGMQDVHAIKATFFVLLCGFVLVNSIFLMMYLVSKLTGHNIYARCKTENCTCGENNSPKCCGLTRIRKRLPYIFWFNVILISLMGLDIVVWIFEKYDILIPFINARL